jgi:type II secretory pathway pseudopilin PulG
MMVKERCKGFRGTYFGFRDSDFGILNPQPAICNPQSGLSLIETTLVILIIAVLSAMIIPKAGFDTPPRSSLDGAAHMIASDIRYAQENAMVNRVSKSVIFTSGSSVYTFNPTHHLDPSGRLPSGVTIGTTITFTFNSLGEPIAGGGNSVTVSGSGGSKTVSVTPYTGKVSIN